MKDCFTNSSGNSSKFFASFALLCALCVKPSGALNKYIQDQNSYVGTWKGTSICQVKNSPCHDEQVVYYITKTNVENGLEIKANKIVDGKEDFMGTIQFKYDPKSKDITSTSMPDAIWHLTKKENNLEGTLLQRNQLYRIIKLTRS